MPSITGYIKEHTFKKTDTLQEDSATDLDFLTLHLTEYKTRFFLIHHLKNGELPYCSAQN